MLLKNSLFLLTALTAGSTVARLHGHERRHLHHAHLQARHQDVDKRGVGDMVYATINGVLVSWINEWSGHEATAAPPSPPSPTQESGPMKMTIVDVNPEPTSAPGPVSTPETTPTPAPAPAPAPSPANPVASSPADWISYPADGQFSQEGFGGKTSDSGSGIFYVGNVGNPWGSNIIEVPASRASQYKYVVKLNGSNKSSWTIVFWNKIGPDGKLTGWYGNSALSITIEAGESKFVAFDEDSQGAWGAADGDKLPTDQFGGYACTWGEFDFGSVVNGGWSGWDVSAIQAQAAEFEVQGMRICDHQGNGCSIISKGATSVINAYTKNLAAVNGIGGSLGSGPVRLEVDIDYE